MSGVRHEHRVMELRSLLKYAVIQEDGRTVKMSQDCTVMVRGHKITIKKGFPSDFASVPRIFWRVFPPWGKYSPAAIVHDWLYRKGLLTRKESDLCFLHGMKKLAVPAFTRWAMYRAVRYGAWGVWSDYREQD